MNISCCFISKEKPSSVSGSGDIAAWIEANPEVILDSVNKYVMKQQEEAHKQQQEQASANIGKYEKELRDTKYAGVINPNGKFEIIEFYDYNCGYCKMASKNVNELLKKRKDVKVILRAIPILGESSDYATRVGIAVLISEPAKYLKFYDALMDGSAKNKDGVVKAVVAAGMKMDRIERVMSKNKDEIESAMNKNLELAREIGINGTPAFIVNGELISGAVSAEALSQKVGN